MPLLTEIDPAEGTRVLCIGRPGSGKTGAIAALANAGYRLRIADFDRSAAVVLRRFVHPSAQHLVDIRTYTDKLKSQSGLILCDGPPKAIDDFIKDFSSRWDGGFTQWHPSDIFILDTLTFCGIASLRYVVFANAKDGNVAFSQELWGMAMQGVERMLELMKAGGMKCAFICNTHVVYQEAPDGSHLPAGMPVALGSKLPPKVGGYFNTQFYFKSVGAERWMFTVPTDGVETKCLAPLPAKLPAADGLLAFVKALGITVPSALPQPNGVPHA